MIKKVLIVAVLIGLAFFINRYTQKEMAVLKISGINLKIEIADTLPKQARGLSGRDSLCEDCGMLFVYDAPKTQRFWMKDMKFPLDIIFMSDNKISEIFPNVPPPLPGQDIPRVQSQYPADHVLEVNAGFASKKGWKVGNEASIDGR